MYQLSFKKNNSKYFSDALAFAKELNCELVGDRIVISISDNELFGAYDTIRQIFSYIQHWKSTEATYNGNAVHPYSFIFYMHQVFNCEKQSEIDLKNCLTAYSENAWSCHRIDNIKYRIGGFGNYEKNGKFWYNYGHFKNNLWIIDKHTIFKKLLTYGAKKGLHNCIFYDENKIRLSVANLPNFIEIDDFNFKIHYVEKWVRGQKVLVPNNIRHVISEMCLIK